MNNMDAYFTIKLWSEFYLPVIIFAVIIAICLILIILEKIKEIGEKIIKYVSGKMEDKNE